MTTPSSPHRSSNAAGRLFLEQMGKWIYRYCFSAHFIVKLMVVAVYVIWSLRHTPSLDFYTDNNYNNNYPFDNNNNNIVGEGGGAGRMTTTADPTTTTTSPAVSTTTPKKQQYASLLPATATTATTTPTTGSNNSSTTITPKTNNNLELQKPPSPPAVAAASAQPFSGCGGGNDTLFVDDKPILTKSRDYLSEMHYANRNYTQQYQAAGYYAINNPSQLQNLIATLQQHAATISNNNNNNNNNGTTSSMFVPCRFHPKVTVKLQHFAHAMEQLYMCIDHWIAVRKELSTATNKRLNSSSTSTASTTMMMIPILLYDNTTQAGPWKQGTANTVFLQGVLEVLESQLGLQQSTVHEFLSKHPAFAAAEENISTTTTTNSFTTIPFFRDVYNGYLLQHVREWNTLVQRYMESINDPDDDDDSVNEEAAITEDDALASASTTTDATSTSTTNYHNPHACHFFQPPRVNLLSRRDSRSIANAQVIADRLSQLQYRYHDDDDPRRLPPGGDDNSVLGGNDATTARAMSSSSSSSSFQRIPRVGVQFFEGTTFDEQVEFFQSTDILISGHGAQLTGLPFMYDDANYFEGNDDDKNGCRQVMELYPQHYALPYYFGSLAHQAGLSHSYMYLSNNETDKVVLPWELRNGATYQERVQARKAKLCPHPEAIVDAVVELISDWHACRCGEGVES